MTGFRVLSEQEIADARAAAAPYEAAMDERRRQIAACAGHEWEMELFHPDDDAYVSLSCTRCPAATEEAIGADMIDLVYAEFDNGVEVEAGKHNSPVPLIVPVTVDWHSYRGWTDYGYEYDVEIDVEQRGSARPVEVSEP